MNNKTLILGKGGFIAERLRGELKVKYVLKFSYS
jgi:hypothetical protein